MGRSTYRVALEPAVPSGLEGELTRRVFFVSDDVLDFALVTGPAGIEAVDLTVRPATDPHALSRKLRFMVARDVLPQRSHKPKVVWRGTADGGARDVFDDLLKQGTVWVAGEGQVAVGEPVLSLMDHLDTRIRSLIMHEFGAREFRYPTLIPTAALRRCGYFQSFPQLVMSVSRLHTDIDTYQSFVDELAAGTDLAQALKDHCREFDHCLPPTMCFHTFHQLADRPLPSPSLAITARGKSFRFESR
jgi:hypothetical protein